MQALAELDAEVLRLQAVLAVERQHNATALASVRSLTARLESQRLQLLELEQQTTESARSVTACAPVAQYVSADDIAFLPRAFPSWLEQMTPADLYMLFDKQLVHIPFC